MSSLKMSFYNSLPTSLQNLAVSIHGLRLKRREYGDQFERLLEQFDQQQWFSESELLEYQNEQLRNIVKHAYQTVPFYRNQFETIKLHPSDIRTVADIFKIPITDSEILDNNQKQMISNAAGSGDRIKGHTSGTTGRSKEVLYDRRVCLVKNAVDWRFKKNCGIEVGDPVAFFMGQGVVPIDQKKPPFWRKNIVLNQLFFSIFHFSPLWHDHYIDALKNFGASAMDGYPSTISMFGEALLARNCSHKLKAAFVTSEMQMPHQRKLIENAFQCQVFDYYGMAERTVFATECEEHKGLHLNTDFGFCELLDENDEPVLPGSSGRVVVTGWHNYTMPLIRYRTNDRATLATEKCPCGRGFPLLASIDGRQEDQITTPDGRYLDVSFAYSSFSAVQDKILESQIYQEASGRIILRIVPRPNFTIQDADCLIEGIKRFAGSDATVIVQTLNEIPRSATGKFRWLVSDVPRRIHS